MRLDLRIPDDVASRIEALRDRVRAAGGVAASRQATVVELIREALDAREGAAPVGVTR